jgi:hypothetical protein
MAESFDDTLRALIRLIPPARALKEDLEKSIHLELYPGTGDLAIRCFQGLQASVATITNDPYIASLALTVAENATDKEKVAVALLAAGQLTAYLEGQTGLVGMGGSKGIHIQTAPSIQGVNISDIQNAAPEVMKKILATVTGAEEKAEEMPKGEPES